MLYSEDDASGPLAAEIKEIESKALAEVGGYINDESRSRRDTLNPAVEWEEVRLDGSFPRTRLIALFKWAGFPDATCGNWVALWRPDGRRPGKWVYDRWSVHDFLMFTVLHLDNRNPKLPPREVDPATGIMWVNR